MSTINSPRSKTKINHLWIVLMLSGLSMVTHSAVSFAVVHKIGEKYGGGVVYYVDKTGNHGLIAAPADINTSYTDAWEGEPVTGRYCWSTNQYESENNIDYAYQYISNTGTAIGQGSANTKKLLAKYPASSYPNTAAAIAHTYRGGGFDDWFLPSRDELNQLFLHKAVVGGFTGGGYWSSTVVDTYFSWFQGFTSGTMIDYVKNETWLVRPVRAF